MFDPTSSRTSSPWPPESVCLRPGSPNPEPIASAFYQRVCRHDFSAPGYCVANLGRDGHPVAFRELMVEIKRALAAICQAREGRSLIYLSASQFDQQVTTRPHLDGGPSECLLMLGYEPSPVDSEMEIVDYARCAFELGMSPTQLLERHNPMFQHGAELLRSYTSLLPCFSPTDYRIVCLNNSFAAFSTSSPAWQGVLHTAKILAADQSHQRLIDSTLLAPSPGGVPDSVSPEQLRQFINAPRVRRPEEG